MIEIDDAGSGSLVGGTIIGVFRRETQEYFTALIPLKHFQHPYFSQKEYQKYVAVIMEKAIQKLNIKKSEPIHICQGYIFDYLRLWLTAHKFNWQNTKISGPLQVKVETSFNQYAFQLGLPKNFLLHARYAFGFHRLFKWVMADFAHRSAFCKTGWKSWQKWSTTPVTTGAGQAARDEYCLKCGKLIKAHEQITILTYETNRPWELHLHRSCRSAYSGNRAPSV
jgi:hypothetical protein